MISVTHRLENGYAREALANAATASFDGAPLGVEGQKPRGGQQR